jgi:hypothetical protein
MGWGEQRQELEGHKTSAGSTKQNLHNGFGLFHLW